ncbi:MULTISPECIES: hypothetical protein [Streptomyces]|uniref:hypothetical protein n=1 Tax=Streptomyces TaxID=1883 RepID=UPI0009402616|nr:MULTISPECIES: hypothetical protein [unclassified Streptomyces]OKJ08910.1 hypothetical protein AMK20_23750 [Streptomyces sp. TSRI0261]QNQ33008.1 hypothetical protein HYC88_04485 [Streptomyces sp. CB00271]
MGEINVSSRDLGRLLADSAGAPARPYQEAFAELADTYRGKSVSEILPLLRRAADEALLGFTDADLREQAEAIRSGARYVLRVRVT